MAHLTRTKLLYAITIINILFLLTNTTTTANDSSVIKLAVLAPSDETSPYALHKIVPAVLYAVRTTLRTARMDVIYRDTECSSTTGPLAAISLQTSGLADMFLGPLCPYVLAPVARYSAVWGLPILTASGQVDSFDNKDQYKTMTRMNGSYSQIGAIFLQVLRRFGWGVLALFFHNSDDRSVGNSDCYFTLGPVYVSLGKKSFFKEFDEANKDNNYAEMLKEISQHARADDRDCCRLLQ